MRVLITGGFGFLGQRVAGALLKRRALCGVPVERLVLADRFVPAVSALVDDPLVDVVLGDLSNRLEAIFVQPVDVVIHLASVVSAEPQSSYGAQKRVCEQLIAEYTRRGFPNGHMARRPVRGHRPHGRRMAARDAPRRARSQAAATGHKPLQHDDLHPQVEY